MYFMFKLSRALDLLFLLPQSYIVRHKIMFSLPWIMLSCITELCILGVDGNSSSLLIQKNIRKV